jgi:hypothetical protein
MRATVVVVLMLLGGAGCGGDAPPAPNGSTAGPSSTANATASRACPFAPLRPTYLPWLAPGEQVPPPEKSIVGPEAAASPQLGAANLHWEREERGKSYYVAIRTERPSDTGGPGKETSVSVLGDSTAELYRGPGSASLFWITSLNACPDVWLELVASDLDWDQAAAEIVKVAEALEEQPAGSAGASGERATPAHSPRQVSIAELVWHPRPWVGKRVTVVGKLYKFPGKRVTSPKVHDQLVCDRITPSFPRSPGGLCFFFRGLRIQDVPGVRPRRKGGLWVPTNVQLAGALVGWPVATDAERVVMYVDDWSLADPPR